MYEVINFYLPDLDKNKFADMYAQTLVYGLFPWVRYYDDHNDFSRREAHDLVPRVKSIFTALFDHITGSSFDPRIE